MGQDRISKEEDRELLYQRVYVVTTTQELCHITINYVWIAGGYLGTDGPLRQAMSTWPFHIDRFELQFDKDFAGNRLFGSEIVDGIHKKVQVFIHSCNTTYLDYTKTSALS